MPNKNTTLFLKKMKGIMPLMCDEVQMLTRCRWLLSDSRVICILAMQLVAVTAAKYLWLLEDISGYGVEVPEVLDGGNIFWDSLDHHLTGWQHQLVGSHLNTHTRTHTAMNLHSCLSWIVTSSDLSPCINFGSKEQHCTTKTVTITWNWRMYFSTYSKIL